MLQRIGHELKHHAPFTLGGTALGIVIMVLMASGHVSHELSETLFQVAHPAHVLLSAIATASLYRLYRRGPWWATVLIGYVGSVGVATLSDCVIPYVGEVLLDMPHAHVHAGFIEDWYIVNPLALLGIVIAMVKPMTAVPHAGHVLLSTLASLFHMTMSMGQDISAWTFLVVPAFLFLAVWIPCCTSDIAFPLLFVGKEDRPPCKHCEQAERHESSKETDDTPDAG